MRTRTIRCTTIILLAASANIAGCAVATDDPESHSAALAPPIEVVSSSHALVTSGCTQDQDQRLVYGQNLLRDAVRDAANAYSANVNNPAAMEFFGARNEDEVLTVYYNLLWAYSTLNGDGLDWDIEYKCDASEHCGPGELAWAGIPNTVVICNPNDNYFWEQEPYLVAHEIWHWLGWGDPNLDGNGIDDPEEVRLIAKAYPSLAIQMPHAYAMYLRGFIEALVP